MMIKSLLVPDLTPTQLSDVMSLYSQTEVVSMEQYPGFAQASEPEVAIQYLLCYRGEKLIGYASVKIKKRVFATVLFGPLVQDASDYEDACAALVSACRRRGVLLVKIFPPYMSAENEAAISSFTKIKYERSDTDFNWCSPKLSLDPTMDELLKGFSENHRRNVKKAQKLNLTVTEINNTADIDIFSEQFAKMYESRGLPVSVEQTKQSFQNIFAFHRKHDTGVFLAVRSETEGIVGGLCINYEGNAAFYHKGYSHPDHRSLPVNHIAFYEAIRLAKERGMKYFDFCGYGLNLKEDDQVNAINRFKDGFGGTLVYYPQTLTIYTTPFSKLLFNMYQRFRKS
jgi:lipid II:glycine glycyltransferase (peptidoglycan interpeptide bridge formation enzyme)